MLEKGDRREMKVNFEENDFANDRFHWLYISNAT